MLAGNYKHVVCARLTINSWDFYTKRRDKKQTRESDLRDFESIQQHKSIEKEKRIKNKKKNIETSEVKNKKISLLQLRASLQQRQQRRQDKKEPARYIFIA